MLKREFKVTHGPDRPKASSRERYCGPSALSAVSGYTAEEVAAWINADRGRPAYYQIRGSHWWELQAAARNLGFGLEEVPRSEWAPDGKPKTMKHVFGNLPAELWNARLVFTVPGHFMAYYSRSNFGYISVFFCYQ